MTQEILVKIEKRLDSIESKMVTHDEFDKDMSKVATREELQVVKDNMVTRDEFSNAMANVATRDELQSVKNNMATRDELQYVKDEVQIVKESMVTRDEFSTAMDEVLTIVRRLDQERVFTLEWVRRIESELERVKQHLHLV